MNHGYVSGYIIKAVDQGPRDYGYRFNAEQDLRNWQLATYRFLFRDRQCLHVFNAFRNDR